MAEFNQLVPSTASGKGEGVRKFGSQVKPTMAGTAKQNGCLEQVFPPKTVAKWEGTADRKPRLRERLNVLCAKPENDKGCLYARRSAWEKYATAGYRTGLLGEGQSANELLGRLRSPKHDEFGGAMAELCAVWYLTANCGLSIAPRPRGRGRRIGDFAISSDPPVYVEVKWCYSPGPPPYRDETGRLCFVSVGDDSERLRGCIDDANEAFSAGSCNLLVVVPELDIGLFADPRQAISAVYGEFGVAMAFDAKSGAPTGSPDFTFLPEGKLLRWDSTRGGPRFTRVSAVAFLEESLQCAGVEGQVVHHFWVCHNPFAKAAVDPMVFGGQWQLVTDREGNGVRFRFLDTPECFAKQVLACL
jgi:hypothetical protein